MTKQKVLAAALLSKAVDAAFAEIRESDCTGYFRTCGYVR